ncbi:MAG: radical SAM protein [Fervidicoccaceae archaeon]
MSGAPRLKLTLRRAEVVERRCARCGFCKLVNACHSPRACVGCLSCYWACPREARVLVERGLEVELVPIAVDGAEVLVPEGVSLADALRAAGFVFDPPGSKRPSLACGTGGCWACALLVDGRLERACVTPVRRGMRVETSVEGVEPLRIIHGPEPHLVGGKATPWWEVDYESYVEAAIWAAGCNLRCPQCQNYAVTYDNVGTPATPREAARRLAACHRRYGTRGVAISGGEPTINRRWLVEFFRELSTLVGPGVRRHLDSNGTVLTPDYIDELVEAGCNNIGVEPKCSRVETYMRITGVSDEELASRYLETAWRAAKYVRDRYGEEVYLGVGLVYNKALVSLDEVAEAGDRIASIDCEVQVTVLDYYPAFRRLDISRPSPAEMIEVKRVLEERGLKRVIVQTSLGHVGPGDRRARLA